MEYNQFPQILAYMRSKQGPFGGNPGQYPLLPVAEALLSLGN